MTHSFDVVALGEAMLEFNQATPGQAQYLQGFGGDTSNAAIAAARAGVRCAYLTRLGADPFGHALLDLWTREGVDASAVALDAGAPTGIYFVTHTEVGHTFSYLRAGSAASRMTPGWLTERPAAGAVPSVCPADVITNARILHLSAITLALSLDACDTAFAAMVFARSRGTLVSFDANLRLKLWPLARAQACVTQAVSLCDLFLPSLDDITALTGLLDPDKIIDWSHARGAKTVALKLGEKGALVSDGTRRMHIAGLPMKLVDATGAGDCFGGNLLARIALGDDVFAAARYANVAAALSVQGYGAVGPLPTAPQVMQAMQAMEVAATSTASP